MMHRYGILVAGLTASALAQTPMPPALLPESVRTAPMPVTPAGATVVAKASAPISRFEKDLRAWPAETSQAVQTMRSASVWLVRMHQVNGRFMGGLNPTLARPLDGTTEFSQAMATRALAQAAAFTGEDKLIAAAGQAILAMLAQTKTDTADPACKVPTLAADKNPLAFAAVLALAISEYPGVDAKLLNEGEMLCAYLRKHCKDDGSLAIPAEAIKADPVTAAMTPGYCFQALAMSNRIKAETWKMQTVERGLAFYRKSQPGPLACATMIPAAVECALKSRSETAAACVFEFADALCASQYTTGDSPSLLWVGSYRTGNEPTAQSAECTRGLVAALRYAAMVPDATRYGKYRSSVVGSLAYVRGLQLADETCQHFDKSFRSRYLLGGVCTSLTDGSLRIDHAAMFTMAQIAFLESGAEKGE